MAADEDVKSQELIAIVREIQDRVRSRHPQGQAGNLEVPLADLLPILHARDGAEGKVAAIGTVNPRPGGPVNAAIQFFKRQIARGLGWFVRDQVEFNRAMLGCVEALLTALNENNRVVKALAVRIEEQRAQHLAEAAGLRAEAQELKDVRVHWLRWREEWEHKVFKNEVQLLRAVADLQAGFQHRTATMEVSFRETVKGQHTDFSAALQKSVLDIQRQLWDDLERIRQEHERLRLEHERMIHHELRVVRQKQSARVGAGEVAIPIAEARSESTELPFDYARFADRFRGGEEHVRKNQSFYVPFFAGRARVFDIGCGRGEFIQVMKDAGVTVKGIDLDEESVSFCRSKGLDADVADLFRYLRDLPDGALDGVFSAQVVEHLAPERVPEMIKLCAAKLERGGVLAIETPNPECLAIFATHFYIDPTHTRPIPPALMHFYFEEFGMGNIEVHRLAPAVETMPSLASLPEDFRESFFGSLDYCLIGRKL